MAEDFSAFLLHQVSITHNIPPVYILQDEACTIAQVVSTVDFDTGEIVEAI
jgi:hypothetical protein